MIEVLTNKCQLKKNLQNWRSQGYSVGLVPTMGNLHLGHINLIQKAQNFNEKVLVSIFVNPRQFSPGEDFDTYPRSLQQDLKVLQQYGVDAVFTPNLNEMYPQGDNQVGGYDASQFGFKQNELAHTVEFDFGRLSRILCSKDRPKFLSGVALVVLKLFNLVKPDDAFFGQKDFQQLQMIRFLCEELNIGVDIHSVSTQRENNGLAMSSRNQNLSFQQRKDAGAIYKTLCEVSEKCQSIQWISEINDIKTQARAQLIALDFEVKYFEIYDFPTLLPAFDKNRLIALVAVDFDEVRLIDNLIIPPAKLKDLFHKPEKK